jgi:hypothetical protein
VSVTIACFQWNIGYREYLSHYVNVLCRAVRRNLSIPHRFVCITDETDGFDPAVELMPLPESARKVADIPSPEGARFPSSFRRLWLLSDEARCLGDRVFQTDIDCVVTRSLDRLMSVDADFVGWKPNSTWGTKGRIGGGTWMVRTGVFGELWERFAEDPAAEIAAARLEGYRGSDQAVLSKWFNGGVTWPRDAGIYQSQDMKARRFTALPDDARLVHFNGVTKPWNCIGIPWVRKHWA